MTWAVFRAQNDISHLFKYIGAFIPEKTVLDAINLLFVEVHTSRMIPREKFV